MIKKLIAFMILAAGVAAAQTTPNLGLELPNYQAPNWGVEINYNFMKLDGFLSGGYTLPAFISQGLTLTNLSPNQCVSTDSNGKLVTAGGACSTFTLTTTGTSGPATLSGGVLNIPQYSSIPTGATNQLLYYASGGTAVTPLTLGANLSITGGTLNATSGGITSVNSQTGPAITLESSDSSISVTSPSANTIDLTTAAGGGGGNPAGTHYVLIGDSWIGDDIGVLVRDGQTISSYTWTLSTHLAVLTVPSTTGYVVGDIVQYVTNSSGYPTFVSGDCTAKAASNVGIGWPFGCAYGQVTAVTSTTITVSSPYDSQADDTCSGGSCGTISDAQDEIGPRMQRQPDISGHGTVWWVDSQPDSTLGDYANYFSNIFPTADYPNGTPSAPFYLIIGAWSDDLANGDSPATIEGYMQTIMADAHARGWIVLIATSANLKNQTNAEAVNYWLKSQVETASNKTSGEYTDWQLDVGNKFSPTSTYWAANGSLEQAGAAAYAVYLNQAVGQNTPIYANQPQMMDDNGSWYYYEPQYIVGGSNGSFYLDGNQSSHIGSNFDEPQFQSYFTGSMNSGNYYDPVGAECSNATGTNAGYCGNFVGYNTAATGGSVYGAGNFYRASDTSGNLTAFAGSISSPALRYFPNQTLQFLGYPSASCLSTDASGNLVSGCPGITTGVNGTAVSSPNFNGTTPAPPSNSANIAFQSSGSNISGNLAITGTAPITVTPGTNSFTVACPTCGTATGGTAVSINSGSALGSLGMVGNLPVLCSDTSGSGTAQSCTTSPTFTPQNGNCWVYETTTTNSGTGLTLAVNGGTATSVAVPSGSGWTTTLAASQIPANKPLQVCYDGTNYNVQATGTAGSGGGYPTPVTVTATTATGEIDLTGCITSAYRDYDIRFSHISVVSGSSTTPAFLVQFSTDNGATWDTGANYDMARYYNGMTTSASSFQNFTGYTGIPPTMYAPDAFQTGAIFDMEVKLDDPDETADSIKFGSVNTQSYLPGNSSLDFRGGFQYTNASGVNAVRLYSSVVTFIGQATCQPLPN